MRRCGVLRRLLRGELARRVLAGGMWARTVATMVETSPGDKSAWAGLCLLRSRR